MKAPLDSHQAVPISMDAAVSVNENACKSVLVGCHLCYTLLIFLRIESKYTKDMKKCPYLQAICHQTHHQMN